MGRLELVATLDGHSDRAWYVAWAPSGRALASCGQDKVIRVWAETSTGWVCTAMLEDAQSRTVRSCEWSPCGHFLAAASFDATTVVWEWSSTDASGSAGSWEWECICTLEGHENEVKRVSWNSAGTLLASCSRDKSVWIWDADTETGQDFDCASVLNGHDQDVKCVVWHPTEDLLVSGSYDDSLRIWAEDVDDWICISKLAGHTHTVWDVAFGPSGQCLASCSQDCTVRIWKRGGSVGATEGSSDGESRSSSAEWSTACTLSGHQEGCIFSLDWSPLSGAIATGASDDSICVFVPSSPTGLPTGFDLGTKRSAAHCSDVNCVRWSPTNARLLASAGDDCAVKLWQWLED